MLYPKLLFCDFTGYANSTDVRFQVECPNVPHCHDTYCDGVYRNGCILYDVGKNGIYTI